MLFGSAVAGVLLMVTLGLLISLSVTERRESTDTRGELNRVNRQLAAIRTEQVKLDAAMRQPGNAVVLDRSVLINSSSAEKPSAGRGFSATWKK